MSNIGIVTDSASDLPAGLAHAAGIEVVPLTVRFGEQSFVDGVDLTTGEFWRRLAVAERLPETAAPSPGAFLEAFGRLSDRDGIVCVCVSERLSGTYQAAVLAAEEASVPVKVVDSGVVSLALGLVALDASEAAARGETLTQVAAAAADAASRANVFAILDTLAYLEKGGRVGRLSALVGGLLDVKPLITLEEGVVTAGGRVRTRSRAIAALAEHLAQRPISRLGLVHSDASAVGRLTEMVATVLPNADPVVAELGPVVGTHTGPGVLGVAYLA